LPDNLITKIELIRRYAREREGENMDFRSFIKVRLDMPSKELDALVRETADAVWARIDCTACANCCNLKPSVDSEDIARLAKRLGMTSQEFDNQFVESDSFGEMQIRHSPCPFLKDKRCSVYEDRPKSCQDYPYLHKKDFRTRMFAMIDNAAVCPIVYNTMEELKRALPFRRRGKG
jgi:Fe-S-cluster containining protein